MKKTMLFSIPVMLFLAMAFHACAPKTGYTVISYNIRNSNANDGTNSWERRKHASVAMVEDLCPDVMGLQEVLPDQLDYLNANLKGYASVGVGREDGARGGEHAPVFYRTARFDLLDSGDFWLSETPGVPSKGWDAALNRIATWAKLRDKRGGREVFMLNTHFDHRGREARIQSSMLIIEKLKELADVGATVFVTGDFNIRPENEAIKPMFKAMLSARDEAPITDSHATFNGWGNDDSGAIIDFIFYGNARAQEYRTILDGYGVPYISDHYPVFAKFGVD